MKLEALLENADFRQKVLDVQQQLLDMGWDDVDMSAEPNSIIVLSCTCKSKMSAKGTHTYKLSAMDAGNMVLWSHERSAGTSTDAVLLHMKKRMEGYAKGDKYWNRKGYGRNY